MSTKNTNDTIGNRTRDLPACNTVPQPAAPPRTHKHVAKKQISERIVFNGCVSLDNKSILVQRDDVT